jgi:hypothetical protein
MASYKLKDIIDKPIRAVKTVSLYRNALDTATPFAQVQAGSMIGILFSIVTAKAGRSVDWLMFYDSNKKAYYVPVQTGTIDQLDLKEQGVKTVEEQAKDAADKAKTDAGAVSYYIEKYVPYILGAIIIVPVLKSIIDKKL